MRVSFELVAWLLCLFCIGAIFSAYESAHAIEPVAEEQYAEADITLPRGKAIVNYNPPDLSLYRVLLTLRFDKNFTADIQNELPDKSLYKTKITTILRDKFKFDCTIRLHSTAPNSQYCIKKFDITSYLQPEPTKIRFVSGAIGTETLSEAAIHIHCSFRLASGSKPKVPMNVSLEKYSSIVEAFRSDPSLAAIKGKTDSTLSAATTASAVAAAAAASSLNSFTHTLRNSGLSDFINRKVWGVNGPKKLSFRFNVPHLEKQQYFVSTKVHFTSKSDQFEFGGRARTFSFVLSLNDMPPIQGDYLGDLEENQDKCTVILTGTVTYRSCLEFYEIFPHQIGSITTLTNSRGNSRNITLTAHLHYLGLSTELQQYQIVVSMTLHVLPHPLQQWRAGGISNEMIDCFLSDNNIRSMGKELGLLQISHAGNRVSVDSVITPANRSPTSSLPARHRAMELGITKAIQLARNELNVTSFPDLRAIIWVEDDSHLNRNTYKTCQLPFPPVFSQNRDYDVGNMLVLTPDFSFFTDFWGGFDHGSREDIWFDVLEAELRAEQKRKEVGFIVDNNGRLISPSKYSTTVFEEKSMTAIYRGKTAHRKFAYLRSTVTDSTACKVGGFINASATHYVSRDQMCSDHQAIVTIPGNGVWSWATKFNLLCNSVSMLVPPDAINGESWETRMSLGLRPWVHYLPVTSSKLTVCQKLRSMVQWMREHQAEAKAMAQRSRELVFKKLNKGAVLRDLAKLLLDYASLNISTAVPSP